MWKVPCSHRRCGSYFLRIPSRFAPPVSPKVQLQSSLCVCMNEGHSGMHQSWEQISVFSIGRKGLRIKPPGCPSISEAAPAVKHELAASVAYSLDGKETGETQDQRAPDLPLKPVMVSELVHVPGSFQMNSRTAAPTFSKERFIRIGIHCLLLAYCCKSVYHSIFIFHTRQRHCSLPCSLP